jgi:hypothetical protein
MTLELDVDVIAASVTGEMNTLGVQPTVCTMRSPSQTRLVEAGVCGQLLFSPN